MNTPDNISDAVQAERERMLSVISDMREYILNSARNNKTRDAQLNILESMKADIEAATLRGRKPADTAPAPKRTAKE